MKILSAALIALSLVACASNPTESKKILDVAGTMPVNYQASIKESIGGRLKDPYSAKYTFSQPEKVSCIPNVLISEAFKLWKVTTTVNSKNSYGAYAGTKAYRFWLSKGKVVGVDQFNSVYPHQCVLFNGDWRRIRSGG